MLAGSQNEGLSDNRSVFRNPPTFSFSYGLSSRQSPLYLQQLSLIRESKTGTIVTNLSIVLCSSPPGSSWRSTSLYHSADEKSICNRRLSSVYKSIKALNRVSIMPFCSHIPRLRNTMIFLNNLLQDIVIISIALP